MHREKLGAFYKKNATEIRLYLIMIAVFIALSLNNGSLFLSATNFSSMAGQLSECGTLALGVALAMIAGGIDLSVVGVANLTGIVVSIILSKAVPEGASDGTVALYILMAILAGTMIALACGLFNGLVIAKCHVPAILATMGSMEIFRGIAIIITEGKPVSGMVESFSANMNKALFGFLPVPFLLFILCAIFVGFLLSRTKYGKRLYMVGTNIKAARFSGINTDNILIKTHILSSMIAFVGGMIMTGRINSAKADVGISYTLQCVLICILGGVKNTGGFGKITGVVGAIITLQMISTGLGQMRDLGFNNYYRSLLWGLILIVTLVVNVLDERRAIRRYQRQAASERIAEGARAGS